MYCLNKDFTQSINYKVTLDTTYIKSIIVYEKYLHY